MKHYKSPDNILFAYEADGSQDYLIPNNYIPITKEEADKIVQLKIEENYQAWKKTEISLQEQIKLLQKEIYELKCKTV